MVYRQENGPVLKSESALGQSLEKARLESQAKQRLQGAVTPFDIWSSYIFGSADEYNRLKAERARNLQALETSKGDPIKAEQTIKKDRQIFAHVPDSAETGSVTEVPTEPDRMTLDERIKVLGPQLGSSSVGEGALMAQGQSAKVKPPVNPYRTEEGLRKIMEDQYAKTDELGRTQLRDRESFATTADREREAAIADRASKMRGETRRRGGIFGEDFAPAAIQQLLAVTPPGSPRRGLLERVMLGAASGSEALTKAQDEREDVMRDIEEEAGTSRISAKEKSLTARAANLTQKQKLDLKKLTNKFDLEKKLAELPAENAARIRKLMLSDAEYEFKQAQIKKELALAKEALAKAGQAGLLTPKQTNELNTGYDRIDKTITGLGMIKGAAISPAIASYRAAAREKANKAYIATKSTNAAAAAYRGYMDILATKIKKGEIK